MIGDEKLVVAPDPRLKEACVPLTEQDVRDGLAFLHAMSRVCLAGKGVGLAAPQIGVMKRAVLVGKISRPGAYRDFQIMLNPSWVPVGNDTDVFEEGCLSHPGVRARIRRFRTVKASWTTTGLELREKTFTGLEARVVQHEVDHLDGVCIVDKPAEPMPDGVRFGSPRLAMASMAAAMLALGGNK